MLGEPRAKYGILVAERRRSWMRIIETSWLVVGYLLN
jgi:hypothetical protein